MRFVVFSDVHANIEAFETFYKDVKKRGVDYFIFLGDIVGYGPNPKECIDMLKDISHTNLMGNHDSAIINKNESKKFNEMAKASTVWTISVLKEDHLDFIRNLPYVAVIDNRYFVHASPSDPSKWKYIISYSDAQEAFDSTLHNIIFVGHTHYPTVFINDISETKAFYPEEGELISIDERKRYIFNVGSIGQPRDNDNRLCYIIHDTVKNTVEYFRVSYDYKKTSKKIIKIGLPEFLAKRLEEGK